MKKTIASLLAALATLSGADVETLKAKLTADDAEDGDQSEDLAPVLAAHAKKVKDQVAAGNSDGYKKAQKDVLGKLEADLKSEYSITTDKTGTELVKEIVAARVANPGAISEDLVKRHPAYLTLENSVNDKVTAATKEATEKVTELEKSYTRREQFQTVKAKAIAAFDALNPILPDNAQAAEKRRERFVKDLEAGTNFELTPSGEVLLLDKEGKRREDSHGNPVKFSDHVKSITDELGFEYGVATPRTSGGNTTTTTTSTQDAKFKGELPKKGDDNKYIALIADPNLSTEEKLEIQAHWAGENK